MALTMGTMVVITVRWMDGETQVYRDSSRHQVENGVLTIDFSRGSEETQFPRAKTAYLPLANIREFTVEWLPPERRDSRRLHAFRVPERGGNQGHGAVARRQANWL